MSRVNGFGAFQGDKMNGGEAMYREDAEKLARQIQDDDPMIEIVDIRVDPDVGGYVIVVYDRNSDEQYVVDHYDRWAEKRRSVSEAHLPELVVEKVHERHGKRIARLRGQWVDVPQDDWPDEVCDALERGDLPGAALTDLEPTLGEVDVIEPGHGAPSEYSLSGNYLVLSGAHARSVWRRILRMANFSLNDQGDLIHEWHELGFDIDPSPRAPMLEPNREEWDEEGVLQEVRDRLLDISEQGFEAILVDGLTNATSYAWVIAGVMGLKVITSWTARAGTGTSGYSTIGYSELLHFKEVEESL
jgi:hypothetical protein